MTKLLKEQIKLLSPEECELLRVDKLPKAHWSETGLYLTCEADSSYTACDFADRQAWVEYFGGDKNLPKGWVKKFDNPLDAIDWLLNSDSRI